MLEIAAVVVLAVASPLLFSWLKWRRLERDPIQAELAIYLIRLGTDPSDTGFMIRHFIMERGWSGREAANRIAHALGIAQQQMSQDLWKRTRAVGQSLGSDYRHGRIR